MHTTLLRELNLKNEIANCLRCFGEDDLQWRILTINDRGCMESYFFSRAWNDCKVAFKCEDKQEPSSHDQSFRWASEKQPNEGTCDLVKRGNIFAASTIPPLITLTIRSSQSGSVIILMPIKRLNVITKRKAFLVWLLLILPV